MIIFYDKHLSSSQITKHLNHMFGKQVSVDMIEDCKKINEEYKNQTKTENKYVNWVTVQEIRYVYDHIKNTSMKLLRIK